MDALCIDCLRRHDPRRECKYTPAGHKISAADGHAYCAKCGTCYSDCPSTGGHSGSLYSEGPCASHPTIPCSCGGTYASGQYGRHTGTEKHRAYIAAYCGRQSDTPLGLEDDRAGEDA